MISLKDMTDRPQIQALLTVLSEQVANFVVNDQELAVELSGFSRYHLATEDTVREALEDALRSLQVDDFSEAVAESAMDAGVALELDRSRGLL